ncbi:hypothetical protein VTI74DRAFT_443 [Chaetomium olivicolor]
MTTIKTIVATGASSGLGFELVRQLLTGSQPLYRYRLILGARDVPRTQAAYDALGFDGTKHSLTILPLELSDLRTTRAFAREALQRIGASAGQGEQGRLDYLLLNAGITNGVGEGPGPRGSRWCEALVVNHLSQHYLVHLLREKLVESYARIVFVSSGAIRRVTETGSLENDLKARSGVDAQTTYSQSKFVQLLGAHWWRRQLKGQCTVVAVSPGLIPNTGLGRGAGMKLTMDMPDAKTVPEGAQSILRAFTREDIPEDPEQIFLTSWGEWWPKDVYALTLDKALQDKWCPSKEEIERDEGLSA